MLPTIPRVAGVELVKQKPATTGSEDFSYFSQEFQAIGFGSAPLQRHYLNPRPTIILNSK